MLARLRLRLRDFSPPSELVPVHAGSAPSLVSGSRKRIVNPPSILAFAVPYVSLELAP